MKFSNLKYRLLFVIWAIPIAWAIVNATTSLVSLLPHFLFERYENLSHVAIFPGQVLVILITFLATGEYISMLSKSFPKNGFWLVYIWIGLQTIGYFGEGKLFSFNLDKYDTYLLLLMVATEAFIWGKNTGRWKRASLLFSGTLFLIIALFSMMDFYTAPFQTIFANKFSHPMLSQLGIVIVLASIFLCDSAAYFAGSMFGRHHFSSISPKKTVEGAVAGMTTSAFTTSIGWYFLVDKQYSLIYGIILGIAIGIFAQVGDLLVSLMKRYFQVKDASNIIPGHGGILDRFDSLFFTAPVVNVILILVVKFS